MRHGAIRADSGQAPTDADLSALIGRHGLRLDKPIVVVGENGDPVSLGRAAYVYWVLNSVGAERLAILRGGHAEWVSEDLPLSNKPAERADYRAEVQFADTWFARFDDVANIAVRNERGALLGARDEMVYLRKAKGQPVQSPPQTMMNNSASETTNALVNLARRRRRLADHTRAVEGDRCELGDLAGRHAERGRGTQRPELVLRI